MIVVNQIEIDEVQDYLVVDVNTVLGKKITDISCKHFDTSTGKMIVKDLSFKFKPASDVRFELHTNDLGIDKFHGLYVFDIKSNDLEKNTMTAVCANYSKYFACVLNKLLKVRVDGCEPRTDDINDPCNGNVLYAASVFEALKQATFYGFIPEAIKLDAIMRDLCQGSCSCNCEDELNPENIIGTSNFKTMDNALLCR